jgi:uncharacterized lipoprotein YmbA
MRFAILLLLLPCVACSRSKMGSYYVLESQAFEPERPKGPSIGIGPVVLPKYTDRINVVTSGGPQRMVLTEQNLWAEPLSEAVTRVLAENLSALLATDEVHVRPWPQGVVQYSVGVNVLRLTGKLGGKAEVQALWTVSRGDDILVAKRTNLERPAGDSYDTYVAALSGMFAELSKEIAAAIPE